MSAIYSKIKKTICLHNECLRKKKFSNHSNCSDMESPKTPSNGFGDETPEDFASNEIIINVLDTNNNCLNMIEAEDESKPRVMTRHLYNRSLSCATDSTGASQPTSVKRVTYGGMFKRFIEAVEDMNKIVLIPSRLQDIDMNENEDIPLVLDTNSGCDMHSGFKLLNSFRNSIVHSSAIVSAGNAFDANHCTDRSISPKLMKQLSVNSEKSKDFLKEIDSGYTSIVNDSQSQSYSSTSSVNTDDECDVITDMSDMVLSFYHHLYGLNVVLEKLIDSAKFIGYKYEQNLQ